MTETTVSAVRLSGRLPKGEANGLDSLLPDLLSSPKTIRYAVVAYHIHKITDITEDNTRFPLVSLDRFEPIVNPEHVVQLTEAMGEALRERTGSTELPFEPDDPTEAERLAQAAEEHATAHPDSVIAKGIKNPKAEKVTDLFKAPDA